MANGDRAQTYVDAIEQNALSRQVSGLTHTLESKHCLKFKLYC